VHARESRQSADKKSDRIENLVDEYTHLKSEPGQFKAMEKMQHEILSQMQTDLKDAQKQKTVSISSEYKFSNGLTADIEIVHNDKNTAILTLSDGNVSKVRSSGQQALNDIAFLKDRYKLESQDVLSTFNDGEIVEQYLAPSKNSYGAPINSWSIDFGNGIKEIHSDLPGALIDGVAIKKPHKSESFILKPLPLQTAGTILKI
jgi:hypothetical protein